ncbi:hypothetical protein fugu_003849 [Takifugu bimaculatus]|uniref:Uncharacterized protein n=1 Tax=Takifugu bimaculatus TaxID=433685 RepID=A0A4Z2BBT3_9TELE|nr:hypothetical protein fugu_003849 [Takifugu bimaculatus]
MADRDHDGTRKDTEELLYSDDPVTEGPEKTSDTGTRHQEERESQREQIVWRLKRLLGDACDGAQITVESQPPSESICTEDFLGRFRDEMVDVTLLEDKLQQQKTDQERHKEKRQNLLSVGGKGATASGKSTRTKEDPQYCQKDHVCCNTEAVMGNESLQQNKLSSKIKTLAGNFTASACTKCKKEEETLKSKKIQIKHAELSLSELQKRRKHALQELARLAAEKAVMGKEKNSLEFVLKESRCRQHELQRQRESSISEHSVVMSVLEREEMDRQLDCAKTDLFAEQRRSREKLESMQDKLEETCEHLQIVTDSEGLLRSRCACLEEKQKQDKEKIEAAEILVNKLQGELGQCTMKKDTLERTLAQKELQLLEFQEQQRALHAERDGLRGALQLLKSQHSCVVKDAQEQTQRMVRVQEMKRDSCARQREQESLLAAVCQTLKEEHEAKYQRLQKDVTQETQKVVLQLEVAQKETERLRRMLEEQEGSCNQINAGLEQQMQQWARDLQAEYQNLHALLDRGAEERSSVQLPVGSTVPEALANLRILREELKNLLGHLQRQLESQKQASECLRIRMEQEVRLQMKHLRTERDRALKSVKERLIQEHIEELSSLKWAHLSDGGAEGGAAASLRKQLQAKDVELRQVQRRMAQWKAQTAARLAFRFEEELTAELERKTSEPDEKMMSGQDKDQMATVCSSAPPLTASSCSSDVASLKLLRYLQDKVKQLRVENQAFGWSSSSATAVSSHLSGADPATASDQRTRTRWDSQPRSVRTAPS